jgi:hypothetical protein
MTPPQDELKYEWRQCPSCHISKFAPKSWLDKHVAACAINERESKALAQLDTRSCPRCGEKSFEMLKGQGGKCVCGFLLEVIEGGKIRG